MDYSLFRENLKVVRLVLGYGDIELCIKADLNHGFRIHDIERGAGQLEPAEVLRICNALGVDMHDMTHARAVPTFVFKDKTE